MAVCVYLHEHTDRLPGVRMSREAFERLETLGEQWSADLLRWRWPHLRNTSDKLLAINGAPCPCEQLPSNIKVTICPSDCTGEIIDETDGTTPT